MANNTACVRQAGKNKGKLKPGWRFGKNGRCVKKKRSKTCKRTKRVIDGVKVALPCGKKTLSPSQLRMLDDRITMKDWNKCADTPGCRVVFFKASNPVMRMPGRKLASKAPGKRGRPMPCVNARGKFIKCRPGPSRIRAKKRRR